MKGIQFIQLIQLKEDTMISFFTQDGKGHGDSDPGIAVVDDLLLDELTSRTILVGFLAVGTWLAMAALDHLEVFAFLAIGTAAVVALLRHASITTSEINWHVAFFLYISFYISQFFQEITTAALCLIQIKIMGSIVSVVLA